ncbi:unnamed protein product [Heterobilharzia americana]|nr:unnamed protein product [Heterobilharzia americana]
MEPLIKAVRDFLNLLEHNQQNIISVQSTPSIGNNPVPMPGCPACPANFVPVNHSYFTQEPVVLIPRLMDNSAANNCSIDTVCNAIKSPRFSLTLNTSEIIELYSWCPVGPQSDGDCCLAGIERRSSQTLCRFVITNRVSSVSESDRNVHTEDGNTYNLRGSFSWSTFCALNPNLPLNSPPNGIIDAFSGGFPIRNWRSWIQGLNYFLSTGSERTKEPAATGSNLEPRNMMTFLAPQPKKGDQYSRILSSRNHDVDLDSFVQNTFHRLENDLQTSNRVVKLKNVKANHHIRKIPTEDTENNSSVTSYSHFTSVSNNQLVNHRSRKSKKRNSFMGRLENNVENGLDATDYMNKPSKQRNKTHKPILITTKKGDILQKRRNEPLRNIVSNYDSTLNDSDDIDSRYRLYTASGKVVDVRKLNRTKSGRLVLPKLDTRYEQSVVLNHGEIMGVSRNADDETILSWLSESSSS